MLPAHRSTAFRASRPQTRHKCRCQTKLSSSRPCVVFTSTNIEDIGGPSLLSSQVRQQLQCETVVIEPRDTATPHHHYSFDKELQLVSQQEPGTYIVPHATAADCVLCAVDQKAGLLQSLGLSPVLVVVLHRGPSLSSYVDDNPAVAVARQASQLGLPSLATCLATPAPSAPMEPAVHATLQLLHRIIGCLKARGDWPAAANLPRAHFPFPEAGRWAIGKELPLPQQAGSSSEGSNWQAADCWALGEDNAWAGRSSSSRNKEGPIDAAEAADILRRAFADGDILLSLNVPPTWGEGKAAITSTVTEGGSGWGSWPARTAFASTRPGVLWPCYQVEAKAAGHTSSNSSQHEPSSAPSSSSSSSNTSWRSEPQDVYGRSLPSTRFGRQAVVTGAFVSQDNTDKVIAATSSRPQQQQVAVQSLPGAFVIKQGTLLNDHATAGDVEAVFSGRAAVSTLQTWPVGHPLSVRDEVLAAALNEDADGLPAWLT